MIVTYGNPAYSNPNRVYQDIIIDGNIEGCLLTVAKGLRPIEETFQRCIPETELRYNDRWYISEDEGFVFVLIDTIEEFMQRFFK